MIDILLCGARGAMGEEVRKLSRFDKSATVICGVDERIADGDALPVYRTFGEVKEQVDVVIDFSSPAALEEELEWAAKKDVPVVLGATGYSDKQLREIENYSKKLALFKSANFSLGINLLAKLARDCAKTLGDGFDIEIIEKHHSLKRDAPSGTALMLAKCVADGKEIICGRQGARRSDEIALHAVRGGTIVGEHEVMFAGRDEIITLSHSARSRAVFAAGALAAARFIVEKKAGLYGMEELISASLYPRSRLPL